MEEKKQRLVLGEMVWPEVEKELPPHVHLTYDGMVIWL